MSLGEGQELLAEAVHQLFPLLPGSDRKIGESQESWEAAQKEDVALHFAEKTLDLFRLHDYPGLETILNGVIQKEEGMHGPVPSHHRDRDNPEKAKSDHQLGTDGEPAKELANIDHLTRYP